MSFRARLTTFFVLIVVIPMAAMGFLVFRLIDTSSASKADARAAGIAATAASMYRSASTQASLDARTVARDLALVPVDRLSPRARKLARQAGIARITVRIGDHRVIGVGNRTAIAPGVAVVRTGARRRPRSVSLSELTAAQYARQLAGPGVEIVVRQGTSTLDSTLPAGAHPSLPPSQGTIGVGSHGYRVVTQSFAGFARDRIRVSSLSDLAATNGSTTGDRALAAGFLAGFLVLAFFFSLLASRALQGQLGRFLDAARRLGGGDFSAAIETTGHDEFAALGEEFNAMSRQLSRRLDELEQERARVRGSIRRIGEAFASGLDRDALLELALRAAMDATDADRGRVSARPSASDSLSETNHLGRLEGLEESLLVAERAALDGDGVGEASAGEVHLAAVALGAIEPGGPGHGVITVSREGRPFNADDLELLRSLAAQATVALANVNMHVSVQRQAVTDDLTGLASHGHFQELLDAQMNEVRRYDYPVALAMIDIDNFKSVNDTYGHQQGDVVLRCVANVLRKNSRDVDVAARYGGEEMALVLPHTELEGAYESAERVRVAIEQMTVPRLDGEGALQITVSLGVAASRDGLKDALIGAADAALYVAKRSGKNRTVRGDSAAAGELPDAANAAVGE